jgi:hypothetical protein
MPRGFDLWFKIDLNQPVDQGFAAGSNDNEAGTSFGHPAWQNADETDTSGACSVGQRSDANGEPIMVISDRDTNVGSGFYTSVTLPSEDSGDKC